VRDPDVELAGEVGVVVEERRGARVVLTTARLSVEREAHRANEVALERDVAITMRRFSYGASGDASASERWHPVLSEQTDDPLAHVGLPASLPPWLTEIDLAYYIQEFSRTGFTGALNWYRNSDRNWELLAAYINARITQPTLFLCGGQDPLFELVGTDTWIERMRLCSSTDSTRASSSRGRKGLRM